MADAKDTPVFSWWDFAKAFYYLLDTQRARYFGYTVVLILVLFYDLLPIVVVGRIVDFFTHYTPGVSLVPFYEYVAFLTRTWGAAAFVRLSVKRALGNVQSNVTYFTRVRGFEQLLDFSMLWHAQENTGNKVTRIQNGVDALMQMQELLSNDLMQKVTSIVGVLVAFFFLGWPFFLSSIIYIGIFVLIQARFYRLIVEMNNENNILLEKAGGTYYEGLGNVLTIKTLGVQDDFKKNVVSREQLSRDFSIKRRAVSNNKWKTFQIVNAFSVGAVLILAGHSFVTGAISLGSIFVVYNYFQRLNGAVTESTTSVERLINYKGTIARMMPIFWDKPLAGSGTLEFPTQWSRLQLTNASFAHPDSQKEALPKTNAGLHDITVAIDRFQKIGVVGASGSGKSTFAKVLLGLYSIDAGRFEIGGVDFNSIAHNAITKEIALVLQESEMFNLSLKENITLMRTFDAALFEKCIGVAQLADVVAHLPHGVETLIGEKGYRLSGGERQRIGIARALYKNPQILVLDEATSSLDSKTEALIQKGLKESLKQTTVISIAHRVSTLKDTDAIVVFADGRIVEQGTYAALSKNKESHFYHLYKQQHGGGRVAVNGLTPEQ